MSFKKRLVMAAAAIGCVMAASTVSALAQDDDDDTFEQKMLRKLMGRDKPPIDYRERSPLVIPPSSELPPPESANAFAAQGSAAGSAAAVGSAAWPQDPDVAAKNKKTTRRIRGADESDRAAAALMSPDEIKRGKVSGGERKRAVTLSDNESSRPLRPGELGGKEYSLFSLFGKSAQGEKPEKFAGEPTRELLTEPPVGYRTPSPDQPYQPPKEKPIFKMPSLWDHGTGEPN
ncbi:MAG: hypothetical protein AB7K64_08520 [Variibacter sp.]